MAKAVLFRNWSDEDFTYTWDKVEYDFPAGSETRIEEGLANHFAKHLTDRELLKMKDDKGEQLMTNHFSRPDVYQKCFPSAAPVEARNEVELQVKLDNTTEVPKKGKRTKVEEEMNPAFSE